jgi:hypothetical protein
MKFLPGKRFLCALCVLCGCTIQAAALDRNAFTFAKYNLTATVDLDQQRLGVRGVITLRNDSASPQKSLSLQISSTLDWKSIQFEKQPVQFLTHGYTSDIDHTGELSEAIVTLPREIKPQESIELDIGYEGTIPLDTTRLTRIGVSEAAARHTDWDRISSSFTAVRGAGYVVWYPVAIETASLSEGNSVFEALDEWKAREANTEFDLNLQMPMHGMNSFPKIFVNGDCLSETSEAGPSAKCSFLNFGSSAAAFVIAPYQEIGSSPVVVNYFDVHKSAAETEAQAFTNAAPFVADWFGPPHQKVNVLDLANIRDVSYENGSMLLTSLTDIGLKQAEIISVHQLAHASFFSPRSWIYEGLAHFMQAAYEQQKNGRQAALNFLNSNLPAISDVEKSISQQHNPKTETSEALVNTSTEEFYRSKAAYVWWMLRDMVGDADLKKTLAAYRAKEDTAPSYPQKLIEAQTHRDLQWFFDDWVYHDRGLPDFHIASVFPSKLPSGGYLVTVTVENLGAAGAEVPITLQIPGGNVTQRLQVAGKAKSSIRFEVSEAPQQVTVNDGSIPESDMSNNTFIMKK